MNIHNKYPIENNHWSCMGDHINLHDYLCSLVIESDQRELSRYIGISTWYLRKVYKYEYIIDGDAVYVNKLENLKTLDPWNRRFPIFPHINTLRREGHRNQYSYAGIWDKSVGEYVCYVVTTSIEGNIVYCVDTLVGYSRSSVLPTRF